MRLANLGAIVMLGAILVQPVYGQVTPAPTIPGMKPPAVPSAPLSPAVSPSGPVDINTASAAELTKVRFIGRRRAAAIIAGRPWQNPEELVAARVVPRKIYDQIKEHLIVN